MTAAWYNAVPTGNRPIVLGDLSQDTLSTVWNGRAYMNFRQKFLDGDLKGSICHGCMKDPGNKS